MESNWPIGPFGPCSGGTCVDAMMAEGGKIRFYSTIPGNAGFVDYTPDEVATFLADVKSGKWDHLQTQAEQMSAALVKS